MKRLLILAILAMTHSRLLADSFGDILQQIEQNNITLCAVRDGVEAEKAENHAGLTLEDPEVEYSHYWGAPSAVGARNDLSITQTLDYATLFGMKRRMARSKDELVEINYQEKRLEIMMEASKLLVDMVYLNKCLAQHEMQQKEMQRAVELSQRAFEAGRINRMDCNKPRIALAELNASIAEEEMQREELLMRLKQLNGGIVVTIVDTCYSTSSNLNGLGMKSIAEQRDAAKQHVAENELKLAKSQSLPQLTVGYASELTHDEKFRGVTIGVSVPLWSNRGNVKRAKAQMVASKSEQQDALFRVQNEYEALKARTERLRQYAQTLADNIPSLSAKSVLHNAFQRGDISALDYFNELTADYELLHKAMLAEREYQQARVTLAWF